MTNWNVCCMAATAVGGEALAVTRSVGGIVVQNYISNDNKS